MPRRGRTVDAGRVAVAGVAWAPTRAIDRVEVQVDDGEWQRPQLCPAATDDTWRQWVCEWDARAGSAPARVRATDGTGETQTDDVAPPAPDGATGWHRVEFRT